MEKFEILSVNYNTPQHIQQLIESVRTHNNNIPIRIIDGSDREPFITKIKDVCDVYNSVELTQFGWNVHHGGGMHYGVTTSKYEWVLMMDSDCELLNGMLEKFHFTHFYEGFACWVNEHGINVPKGKGILYLHPEILLINVEKYRQSPYKMKKHGAPCIDAMRYTDDNEKLIIPDEFRVLYKRIGRGTCGIWGYNL
jgi:glycosyltransferase involved in cell wall biosynthesis